MRKGWREMVRALTVCLTVLILASAGHAGGEPQVATGAPCDGVLVPVAPSNPGLCIKPGSGESFKDCPECPEMVVVPAGSFTMGSPENEEGRFNGEDPQHRVTIPKPFAAGRFAVTFGEWDACVADGGCDGYRPDDEGWGRADRPVVNVSWNDAKAYLNWLSKKTGRTYRLLSEAEHEYVTRAGTTTPFWWGSSISTGQANYEVTYRVVRSNYEYWANRNNKTLPVNAFKPNPWGLYQVHGNVREWVEDCWHDSYQGAPADGSAWTSGECKRVSRGGSWNMGPRTLRAASRYFSSPYIHIMDKGFRVARTIAH